MRSDGLATNRRDFCNRHLRESIVCFRVLLILLASIASSGCRTTNKVYRPENIDQGLTIIVPGILGTNFWDKNIARGIEKSKFKSTCELHDWTRGRVAILLNFYERKRKREHAKQIAAKILSYQDDFPGRPVHLVSHSGGASIVVAALEQLPEDHKVNSVVMLAPAFHPRRNLHSALRRTERGIHSFYSWGDFMILGGLTTIFGTSDWGPRRFSAGSVGFKPPKNATDPELALFDQQLQQHGFKAKMITKGNFGGHFGWTSPPFVADYVAPILEQTRQY